ncbi:hypothetical protein BJV78DRAFT_159533 [Lactifluus subvellereus]|nr:hypothetical protein BJV78DRAFT_159533 [Lactifluus subvellereus]
MCLTQPVAVLLLAPPCLAPLRGTTIYKSFDFVSPFNIASQPTPRTFLFSWLYTVEIIACTYGAPPLRRSTAVPCQLKRGEIPITPKSADVNQSVSIRAYCYVVRIEPTMVVLVMCQCKHKHSAFSWLKSKSSTWDGLSGLSCRRWNSISGALPWLSSTIINAWRLQSVPYGPNEP